MNEPHNHMPPYALLLHACRGHFPSRRAIHSPTREPHHHVSPGSPTREPKAAPHPRERSTGALGLGVPCPPAADIHGGTEACADGWRCTATPGLANPLTHVKCCASSLGKIIDVLVAVWSMSLAGCIIGIVGSLGIINKIVATVRAWPRLFAQRHATPPLAVLGARSSLRRERSGGRGRTCAVTRPRARPPSRACTEVTRVVGGANRGR